MKLNTKAFGLTFGLLWGFGFFFGTWWMIIIGKAPGAPMLIRSAYNRVQHYSHRQSGRLGLGFFRRLNRRRNFCLVI
jgi:hypothetical protein